VPGQGPHIRARSGIQDPHDALAGATFAPGVQTTGLYVFNSHRVTYRYEPVRREHWMFGVGVTIKVRDAQTLTRLDAGGLSAAKTNVGAVPLVNFKFERKTVPRATFQVEGDARAAPPAGSSSIRA
jgi:hypothetical protein